MMDPTRPDDRCNHEWNDDRHGDGRHCIHCGMACRMHKWGDGKCVVCGKPYTPGPGLFGV